MGEVRADHADRSTRGLTDEGTPTLNVGGKRGRPGMLLDDRLGNRANNRPEPSPGASDGYIP